MKESELERQQMEGSTPASERVREGWDALPGSEQAVDYDRGVIEPPRLLPYATISNANISDLVVEVTIRTPDGYRMSFEEAQEYELGDDGLPTNFEQEDIHGMWERVVGAVNARLNQ